MSNMNSAPEKVQLQPAAPKVSRNKRAKYNRVTVFDVILYIIMILFMACIIVPFLHIIVVSLSDKGNVAAGNVGLLPLVGDGIGITFANFKEVLSKGDFVQAYGNTILYTVLGTFLSLMTTAMAAYALARRKLVGHGFFSIMITITMFFGGGLIPTVLTVKETYQLDGTIWSQILPGLISTWNLIIMRSFFVAYPKEIIESGEIDGLQEAGVFMRLVLPTSKAALATIGLYYAVAYWNQYMPSLLYLSGRRDLQPVMHVLQKMIKSVNGEQMMGSSGNEGSTLLAATVRYCAIMIVVTPIMCVYPFIQKYFVKGVMVGSVKG